MIKAVIFDWGGVLIEHPTVKMKEYLAGYFGLPAETVWDVVKASDKDFMRGKISEAEMWARLAPKAPVAPAPDFSPWREALRYAHAPRPEVFAWISSLHTEGFRLGLLSNTEAPCHDFFYEQSYLAFDAVIFSCDCGFLKPEKEIYELALKRLNVRPEEAVFIDDLPENIRGAGQAGMHAILFESVPQVKAEWRKLIGEK